MGYADVGQLQALSIMCSGPFGQVSVVVAEMKIILVYSLGTNQEFQCP